MAVEEIDIHEPSSKSYTGLSPGWTRDHSQQLSFFIIKTRTRPKYSIKAEERGIPSKFEKRHYRCSNTKLSQYQHYRPSNNTSSSDMAHVQRQNWERDSYSINKLTADSTNLQEGTNYSLATRIFISWSEIFLDPRKTRRRLRTLSLRMPLLQFNESLRTIQSEHRIPYIDSQWIPILSDSTVTTIPQIKPWKIQAIKWTFLEKRILLPDQHERNKREQATLQSPAYVYRDQASHQPNARHTVVFTL